MKKKSISCLLPVINETFSLKQTIDILESNSKEFIREYIILIADIKDVQKLVVHLLEP